MGTTHPVRSQEAWNQARKELLAQEKHFTQLREQLAEKRRALPWTLVERDYTFHCTHGESCSLRDLFNGKSQLLVYHLMFAPEWEAACKSCSFWADSFDRNVEHLAHRDVTLVAISRAPFGKLRAYAERMGWKFPWLSCEGNTFSHDFGASFNEEQRQSGEALYNFGTIVPKSSDLPGFSVFARDDDGKVFRTYSCYARGIDMMNPTYQYLDLTPKGRDEGDGIMTWLRRRDEYPR